MAAASTPNSARGAFTNLVGSQPEGLTHNAPYPNS